MLSLSLAGLASAGEAEQILKASGFQGGLVVHIGSGDGTLTAQLKANDATLVHGLDTNPTNVLTAREALMQENLHGPVSFATFDGTNLPYADGIANLVVVSGFGFQPARNAAHSAAGGVSGKELARVLVPSGAAIVSRKSDISRSGAGTRHLKPETCSLSGWSMLRKPRPTEMDEWTHYLRSSDNNAVSLDKLAGPPRGLRWVATPVWARHHDKLASISSVVTSGGRVFYIVDRGPAHTPDFKPEWRVEARDAFNGILLWQQPMKSWVSHMIRFRSGPVQIARLLVAQKDKLYVAMGINEPVSALDAATGNSLK